LRPRLEQLAARPPTGVPQPVHLEAHWLCSTMRGLTRTGPAAGAATPIAIRDGRWCWMPIPVAPVSFALPETLGMSCCSASAAVFVLAFGGEDQGRALARGQNHHPHDALPLMRWLPPAGGSRRRTGWRCSRTWRLPGVQAELVDDGDVARDPGPLPQAASVRPGSKQQDTRLPPLTALSRGPGGHAVG